MPLSELEYNGPDDYAVDWQNFAKAITQDGSNKAKLEILNRLNELAFGNGVEHFLSNSLGTKQSLKILEDWLTKVCAANSALTKEESGRPLNRALVDALMQQWIELEKQQRPPLYPPPPTANYARTTDADRDAVYARRDAMLATPEGALLSSLLWSLNEQIIQVESMAALKAFGDPHLRLEDILSESFDIFKSRLFTYQAENGASFTTHLGNFFQKNLIRTLVQSRPSEKSMADFKSEERVKLLFQSLASPGTDKDLAAFKGKPLQTAMGRLPTHVKTILLQRYEDGMTLEEAGNARGVTRERARQLQNEGLQGLRHHLENKSLSPEEAAARIIELRTALNNALSTTGKSVNMTQLERDTGATRKALTHILDDSGAGSFYDKSKEQLLSHVQKRAWPTEKFDEFKSNLDELQQLLKDKKRAAPARSP